MQKTNTQTISSSRGRFSYQQHNPDLFIGSDQKEIVDPRV